MPKLNRTARGSGLARAEALEPRTFLSASILPRDVNATGTDSDGLFVSSYDGQRFDHVAYQGRLYFVHEDGVHGVELFRSDGTAAGTVLVKDINPGSDGSYPRNLTVVNGLLYFSARESDAGDFAAWRTDGTEAGTVRLGGPAGLSVINFAAGPGGTTLFGASSYFSHSEFWRTDGTAAGTSLVKATPPASPPASGLAAKAVSTPDATYFIANDSLWRCDGTAAGTYAIKTFDGYYYGLESSDMVYAGGRLFVVARYSDLYVAIDTLYVCDGSVGNATLLKQFPATEFEPPATGNIRDLTVIGDTVYFSADNGTSGRELWAATAAGVRRVRDIIIGATGSNPSDFVSYHGALYFAATTFSNGTELWTSDGTSAGTHLVTDLTPSSASSSPGGLAVANDRIFFSVAPDGSTTRTGVFTSDGTAGGTQLVRWFDESNDIDDFDNETEIRYRPLGFTAVAGGQVLYTARDASTGGEIWTTDGTSAPAATHLVRDLYPGSANANPVFLGSLGPRLFYFADDGIHGTELWATDGTAAGTTLVKDIRAGAASSGTPADGNGGAPASLGVATSQYVFFTAVDNAAAPQAWRTDGTAAGTIKLTTTLSGEITAWFVVGDKAYFRVGSGSTAVYYISDGTPAGTVRLSENIPSIPNGTSTQVQIGDDVYFFKGTHPYATLWRTDGTPDGTMLVASVNAAAQLALAGDKLFFPVLDFVHGFETWAMTVDDQPPLVVQSATFAPGGGSSARLTFRANRPLAPGIDPPPYSHLEPKVTSQPGGKIIPTRRVAATVNPDGSVAFTFPGGLPADGRYHVVLPAGSVFDTSGSPQSRDFTFDFVILRGDANGDGAVGGGDFNLVASHFGLTGQTWATGDFDGDGIVGATDFNLLATNFGKTLSPPPSISTRPAVAPTIRATPQKAKQRASVAVPATSILLRTARPTIARRS